MFFSHFLCARARARIACMQCIYSSLRHLIFMNIFGECENKVKMTKGKNQWLLDTKFITRQVILVLKRGKNDEKNVFFLVIWFLLFKNFTGFLMHKFNYFLYFYTRWVFVRSSQCNRPKKERKLLFIPYCRPVFTVHI